MKKTILSILFLASVSFAFAQKNPFEKFSDMDGVTSVYISKTMLSLMPKNSKMDYGGVNVGGFLNKLTAILILTSEDQKIAPQMLSLANDRIKKGHDYELLMRVKSDDNDNVNFFMKGKPSVRFRPILRNGRKPGAEARKKRRRRSVVVCISTVSSRRARW